MDPSIVVWWTIDSLRRDVTDVYGGTVETPALSKLARQGQSYQGLSEATWTLPAVTSLLTGMSPNKHGVQTKEDRLQPGVATLPQYFRHSGWRTLGIVANPWFTRRKGLDVGFDRFYNITENKSLMRQVSVSSLLDYFAHFRNRTGGFTLDVDKHPSEPLIVDLASEWIEEADKPVFAMVHTQGAHSPYHSPSTWNRYQDETDSRRADYLNLIDFVAAHLGRFLDRLPKDTVVIVTGDHGEALGESGEWGHRNSNLELLYKVPLIIAGASSPFSESDPVTHVEVHEWLRDEIAPLHQRRGPSKELQKRLKTLGYVDGAHSA